LPLDELPLEEELPLPLLPLEPLVADSPEEDAPAAVAIAETVNVLVEVFVCWRVVVMSTSDDAPDEPDSPDEAEPAASVDADPTASTVAVTYWV
jgi:hypothetical protein